MRADEIKNTVSNMKVVDMRKEAVRHGIKNASRYKREVLEKMLIDAMVVETGAETRLNKLNRKELVKLMRQYKLPYCCKHRTVSKEVMISRLSAVMA